MDVSRGTSAGLDEEVVQGRLSRRALLQAIGVGGAVAAAGVAGGLVASFAPSVASAQEEAPIDPEIEQLAFDLDLDVESIFRFVADEVRYDAYPGILRGAKGTLWGLAGNSADQALLLADLLRAALVDVRFVTGELDPEAKTDLLASLATDVATAREHAARVLAVPPAETTPGDQGSLSPAIQTLLDEFPERQRAYSELAQSRLSDGIQTIEDALTAVGVSLPAASATLPEHERGQHVWVQYRSGTDWIDLDPTFTASEMGTVYATPNETLEFLPEDLEHAVGVRIESEVIRAGKPMRGELLSYRGRSQDLVGVPITVIHAQPEALAQFGITIAAGLGGQRQWLPHVVAGHQVVAGSAMTFKSEATTTDVLGGEASAEGDTLAAWLIVEVESPDGGKRTVERTIFDRVGAEHRVAGDVDPTTLPEIEVAVLDEVGPVYLPLLATSNIAVVSGAVPGSYFRRDLASESANAQFAVMNHGYHFVRQSLQADQIESSGLRLYASGPNVTVLTMAPIEIDGDAGRLSAGIDLIHQAYGAALLDGVTSAVHPGVISGVLGHVAERSILGESAVYPADLPSPVYVSVGRIFEEARRTGIAIQVLQPGTSPAGVDLPAEAVAQISERLANGWMVIVPAQAVLLDETPAIGWWQVDPLTGETFDQMAGGGSSETVEYEGGLGQILALIFRLQKLAACIGGVAAAIMGAVLLAIGEASINDPAVGFGLGSLPYTGAMCLVSIVH